MGKKLVFLARKNSSSRMFLEDGAMVPVTLLKILDSRVVDRKTIDKHGYDAVVVASGSKLRQRMNKAEIGFGKKFGVDSFEKIYEIRPKIGENLPEIGENLDLGLIKKDLLVDVCSVSKGKGFAGSVKRWNFATQDASHGNSVSHRVHGSIGSNQPGRVWKGKKMAGHLGCDKVTLRDRKVVFVDGADKFIAVKGPVAGANGEYVYISCFVE